LTRYPFQANTYGLPISVVKDCLLGFIENDFTDKSKINNYEDWIYYMFGKGIAEHFMIPYSQKFWGVEANKMTVEWVDVRHPKPSLEEVVVGALQDQSKGFGVNAEYRYPMKRGFGSISEAFVDKCRDRIRIGMEATRIDIECKQIEFNGKHIIPYNTVLSSLPLPELINIIPEAPNKVMRAVSKLRMNSIFVVNIGVNKPDLTDKNWIYYMEKEYSFIRVSFPSNQSDHVAPPGVSTIMAEVAYGNDNPLPEDRDNMPDRVLNDLIKAEVINENDEIVYLNTIDIKYGYVIYDKDRKPAIKVVHDYLKSHNIIPFGRYGQWSYLWSDEAILSGKRVAEKLDNV